MGTSPACSTEELVLHELLDGLFAPRHEDSVSVGLVGSPVHAPRPPAHCLRVCLDGHPEALAERGCGFLAQAALGVVDSSCLSHGRCPQGFQVVARAMTLVGHPAVLLTVAGQPPGEPRERATPLLEHLDAATRLVQRIGQVLEENTGFANEVVQNYEQLNLIFDLTQQIAGVTDVAAIEALLLRHVGRLLAVPWVAVVTAEDECRTYDTRSDGGRPPPSDAPLPRGLLLAAVRPVRQSRQVRVTALDDRPALAGPLLRLDNRLDVVVAAAPPGREPFTAGDMLVIESVLAFGGQILSNTELHERVRRMSMEVTRALVAAIDKKDHYTSGHSERVGFLTRLTGREFGLSAAQLQIVEWAGLLHDVGKIGIPEEILCKPGKLTPAEFDVIKQHPRMGYEILKPIASFELVLDGVLYHHEQPDGGGYPEGLRGSQIPLVARIIHVCDTFDALTSTRSYRQAFSLPQAMDIIRAECGTRLDEEAAAAFFRAFAAYRKDDPHDYAARFAAVREQEPAYAVA